MPVLYGEVSVCSVLFTLVEQRCHSTGSHVEHPDTCLSKTYACIPFSNNIGLDALRSSSKYNRTRCLDASAPQTNKKHEFIGSQQYVCAPVSLPSNTITNYLQSVCAPPHARVHAGGTPWNTHTHAQAPIRSEHRTRKHARHTTHSHTHATRGLRSRTACFCRCCWHTHTHAHTQSR